MVRNWLSAEMCDSVEVLSGYVIPGKRSKKGYPMPYDILLAKNGVPILFVEVDGPQHFVRKHHHNTAENDLQKELDAIHAGVPMLRLQQNDVWHARFDWKRILGETVAAAIHGRLEVAVHRSPLHHYAAGEYSRLRKGTIVEV